jgi:hypothetical protein
MMTVELSGIAYEVEGLLYRGLPACSLRRAAGGLIKRDEFQTLSDCDQAALRNTIQQHIAAVALLSGAPRPPPAGSIPASSVATGAIGCHPQPSVRAHDSVFGPARDAAMTDTLTFDTEPTLDTLPALLTEREVAERLRCESEDPIRFVRELVRRHGVPYTRVGSKMRLTPAQLALLLEAITCSRSESAARSGTLEAQFRPRAGSNTSMNAVREKLKNARRALTQRS